MSTLTPSITPTDHVLGSPDALVTFVEYGDYECPFCGRAHPIVKDALGRMGDEVAFAFRHFPLAQAHPHALSAALAAEAAGAQGQFWGMHDILFENQEALEDDDLVTYAEVLELDVERFMSDFQSDAALQKVKGDFRSGIRSGVNGTPTFFIEGRRFDGAWDAGQLTHALEEAVRIQRSRGSPPRRSVEPEC